MPVFSFGSFTRTNILLYNQDKLPKGEITVKKLFCILLGLLLILGTAPMAFASAVGTTYYIDSENGNDDLSGMDEQNAWKSVRNIPFVKLGAGDKILFKRGGTYYSDYLMIIGACGTKEQPVLISAYGEGDKPLLTTDRNHDILWLKDCSYVTVENLEFTAHNGGGIWINTESRTSVGVTLRGLTMHDIQNTTVYSRDDLFYGPAAARACVMVKNIISKSRFPVNDLTIEDCEMYDCGNGISIWGSWNEQGDAFCLTEEEIDPVYNERTLVRNCYFHDMDAEAVIVGMCDGALVTNCRSIDCCQGEGYNEKGVLSYANAAMWFWGSENSTIQYCEIAGQKNLVDGMACDFDSHTNNCTYQYIYSHDNVRFVCLCPNYSGQHNNTIRYCLSVNDNKGRNRLAASTPEIGLKFYNNTIVNAANFVMSNVQDGYIANNIFTGNITCNFFATQLDKNGEVASFTGTMTNNCFYGVCVPSFAKNSVIANPGFSGTDYTNPESFRLSAASPLIGKGARPEGVGCPDFFGNDITSANIGCYSADGESEKAPLHLFDHLYRLLSSYIGKVYQVVYEFFCKVFVS